MRVAIVAECFLPDINGVTNSVLRVVEHLERSHHEALVIAPGPGPTSYSRTPVERVPGIELPFYRSLSVGLPTRRLGSILTDFRPDVVHLAAPVVLGAAALEAAVRRHLPTVAVYQTDLAGFGARYGLGFAAGAGWRWLRWVHGRADLTLAPSSTAAWTLRRHGIDRVALWGRGVDRNRFHPRHRSPLLRRALAPNGETLIGYVGRLAPEKQVHLLQHAAGLPGTRTVIIGDGPSHAQLRRLLPAAVFTGALTGQDLSAHLASLDVFVHTGFNETFCQAIQEALAAGVPVVAPAAGGPLDTVRHGYNGFLYPPSDPVMLRQAVAHLVADPALRSEMSRRAEEVAEGRTWEALGRELVGHYLSVQGREVTARRVA